LRKNLAQSRPALQRPRRAVRVDVPGSARERAFDARGRAVLAQFQQRDWPAAEFELKIRVAVNAYDDVADDRVFRTRLLKLARGSLPARVGRGELRGRLAAGERQSEENEFLDHSASIFGSSDSRGHKATNRCRYNTR